MCRARRPRRAAIAAFAAILLVSCSAPAQPQPYREFRDDLMGTFMSITAHGENAEEAVRAAFERIEQIDYTFNTNNPESIVSNLPTYGYNEGRKILRNGHLYDVL